MTYRWSKSDIELLLDSLKLDKIEGAHKYPIHTDRMIEEVNSLLEGMKLTNQDYVYIKGQPAY